jgi:hypothetical protein
LALSGACEKGERFVHKLSKSLLGLLAVLSVGVAQTLEFHDKTDVDSAPSAVASACQAKTTPDREFAEVLASDKASLRVEVLDSGYLIFGLAGKGFKPYESMTLVSTSCHEVLSYPIEADKNGVLPCMSIAPAVEGKTHGKCQIQILRDQGPICVQFPWGLKPGAPKIRDRRS